MALRSLTAAALLGTLVGLGWHFDAATRVRRSSWELLRHQRLSYGLAFLVAPQSELRPRAFGSSCADCLEFEVDAPDATALQARFEPDQGPPLDVVPRTEGSDTFLQLTPPTVPLEGWLTWRAHSTDPGFGVHPPMCGQALSEIGVRPTRRPSGRVGVRLSLGRTSTGQLDYRLHGPQPFVP